VLEGPYADFSGSIIMIDIRSGAVIVELSIFGGPLKAKLQLSEVTRA
jgi:transcription antitermination factor NusG